MSITKLPQEILQSIVSILDTRSVGVCLLAGRCFRVACEAELFYSVILQDNPTMRRRSFITDCVFFASSRHLAPFVKELSIELKEDPSEAKLLEMVLVRVAAAGTLKYLELVVAPWMVEGMPDGLVEAAIDVMGRPQLERIELGYVYQRGRGHLDFLCKAITEQRPGIDRIDWRKVHTTILVDEEKEFSLRPWAGVLSLLTTLTIRWDFLSAPSYLTEYPILSQLRALTLQFLDHDALTLRLEARPGQLLSLLPTLAPALEALRFEIHWILNWDPEQGVVPPDSYPWITSRSVPWPNLGTAEFSESFPALERVECAHTIRCTSQCPWEVDKMQLFAGWLREWTEERMAGPLKAGILQVSAVAIDYGSDFWFDYVIREWSPRQRLYY
ncbi:Exosome component Rrp46 [Mycena chlorophos]|uniref:Exosome component Rrp46 n=1 Tax=Mycena chlorophos TaxID=658473 RepID=A0A8H6TJ32_MYCCL|nr:Exosome component Rrp46 [Mycena chlorophos]